MKRFIAVLICALMLTSLLPSVAFAEEVVPDPAMQEGGDGGNIGGEAEPTPTPTAEPTPTADPTPTTEPTPAPTPTAKPQMVKSPGASKSTNTTNTTDTTDTTYTVTVSASPSEGGTVSGGGTYDKGAQVTVTATANDGYAFVQWTENDVVVSTDATYIFTATADRTLVAEFAAEQQATYTITATVNPTEGGTVTGAGAYAKDASVTLSATANTGYKFVKWTENGTEVSTNATYTFTVTGNRSLVAVFQTEQQTNYNITATVNPDEGGTVSGAGTYAEGASVTLTATAKTGYTFVAWTKDNTVVSTDAEYTFTAQSDCDFVANFKAAPAKVKTTTNITASCSKVTRGCAVTFSVTVKDASGKNVTDGYVQLYVNGAAIGSAVKAGKGITWKFTAAEKTKFVLGDNVIKAVYGGTDTLAPSEDAAAVKMVKPSNKHYKPCCSIDHHSGKCVNVCPGEDVTFKVNLSCGETCQWYVDKGDGCGYVRIKGAICHSYTVKDTTSKMDGYRYRCVIRNACGIVETPTFTLNIACGTLATPKTGDMGLLSSAAAMGAAAVCLLKRRKDEE